MAIYNECLFLSGKIYYIYKAFHLRQKPPQKAKSVELEVMVYFEFIWLVSLGIKSNFKILKFSVLCICNDSQKKVFRTGKSSSLDTLGTSSCKVVVL